MNKEALFDLMRTNPVFYLATLEDDQPRVRALFLYRADEQGIIFHTGKMKDLYRQLAVHPRVEMCFYDAARNVQVRVWGELEQINDRAVKDEICAHPTRAFLKPWREGGPLEDFYNTFTVWSLKNGTALWWTMQENFAPKRPISLGS
jgi:uncharacterized pyridoxamine 5'-phosphate oxidase family protein